MGSRMENRDIAALKEKLNSQDKSERMTAIETVKGLALEKGKNSGMTNNHVHSTYSFSPYTPARIVYEAYQNHLDVVGLMDHDSIGGAEEFIEAGKAFGIATTIGFEIRTDWLDTPFKDRRLNNPDQIGCAYFCVHGVPHQKVGQAAMFLKGIVSARNERNRRMTERINAQVPDIHLSFEEDVVPISMLNDGGSITERHILFALVNKLFEICGKGEPLIEYLSKKLGLFLSESQRTLLLDIDYAYYAYDVLNVLKGNFVAKIFIPAEPPETPTIQEAVMFCKEIGAILSYAYLGDVTASPTGDKKAQVFEDAYLDELFAYLEVLGIPAVAYMPSRNTREQVQRIMALSDKHGFFQISGEDINQPRQSFICEQLMYPEFSHLVESAWALIGHERRASENLDDGMFSDRQNGRDLKEKTSEYAAFGRESV